MKTTLFVSSAILIAVGLSGCNRSKYENFVTYACTGTVDTPIFSDDRPLTPEERNLWLKACTGELLRAVEPCIKEYDFGTDSGIQCLGRYGDPILLEGRETLIFMRFHPLKNPSEK
jgi:hypothetical protein